MTGSWRWTPASDPADFWLGRDSLAPQVFPLSMTAWQLTAGPERQFTCGPRVLWKERLRRGCEGTPPGFSFLLLFFPFFVRALILSPLSRVMGNVYVFSRIKGLSPLARVMGNVHVFSRIKATFSGAFRLFVFRLKASLHISSPPFRGEGKQLVFLKRSF